MILFSQTCVIRCLQYDTMNYLYLDIALLELGWPLQTFAMGAWQIPQNSTKR